MRNLCVLLIVCAMPCVLAQQMAPASAAPKPHGGAHRVLVVDGVIRQSSATPVMGTIVASSGDYHTAPGVIAEIMKTCPAVISVTTSHEDVEYILTPQPRGSTLTNAKGDVLYVSPAFKVKNVAKDICLYISGHAG